MAENSAQSNAQRAVLVTGSSSGIGKEIALYLARQGFLVFASVRREESVGELREYGEPNLLPLFPLDLAIPRTIADASEKVVRELERRRLPGLYGVVNNAGGGGVGPIELMSTAQFQGELTARLVGPVDLLQRLLPSVRAAGGRVVWIVTPATVPIPFVGSIHVCDFAANGLARTLAIELGQRRTPQIMVRCGGIATGSPERSHRELERNMAVWPPERLAPYRKRLEENEVALNAFDAKRTPSIEVAKVVARALEASRPRSRYQIGYMSGAAAFLELLPQRLVDRIMASR